MVLKHSRLALLGLVLAVGVALATTVMAATVDSWSYSDYSHGSYVPKEGTGQLTDFDDGNNSFWLYVDFRFDSYNVNAIEDYNNGGDNPGTSCDNVNAYLTIDCANVPDGAETLDAGVIATHFGDCKVDFEDDNGDGYCEEAELVVFESIYVDAPYDMDVLWIDYRTGQPDDSGQIQVQFAMSNKPWWSGDYNNCVQSDVIQSTLRYGDYYGQP